MLTTISTARDTTYTLYQTETCNLRDALEDVLHDRDVAVKTVAPVGCAIKREL